MRILCHWLELKQGMIKLYTMNHSTTIENLNIPSFIIGSVASNTLAQRATPRIT